MEIKLNTKKIFIALITIISSLTILSVINTVIKVFNFDYAILKVFYFFDLNGELNIPTFYAGLTLVIASILLLLIARHHVNDKQQYGYWIILAGIFLFISFDEMMQFHERISFKLQTFFNTSGVIFFAWIIPYSIIIILTGIWYIKFFQKLPKKTFKLFILSAVIFVGGVFPLEMIQGVNAEVYGYETAIHYVTTTIEETFEMIGTAIFIYALLDYIENIIGGFNILGSSRIKKV